MPGGKLAVRYGRDSEQAQNCFVLRFPTRKIGSKGLRPVAAGPHHQMKLPREVGLDFFLVQADLSPGRAGDSASAETAAVRPVPSAQGQQVTFETRSDRLRRNSSSLKLVFSRRHVGQTRMMLATG